MDFVRRPPFLIKFCHDRLFASPRWPAAGLRFVPNAPGASRLDLRNRTQKCPENGRVFDAAGRAIQ